MPAAGPKVALINDKASWKIVEPLANIINNAKTMFNTPNTAPAIYV